jgi:hypothetical protein
MANIATIKRELYEQVKSEADVTGAGIKGEGPSEHIVIFVKRISAKIKEVIPGTYKGKKVKVEVKKTAVPL